MRNKDGQNMILYKGFLLFFSKSKPHFKTYHLNFCYQISVLSKMNSKNFTYLPCSIIKNRNLHVYGSHTRIKQQLYKNKTKQVYKSIFCVIL